MKIRPVDPVIRAYQATMQQSPNPDSRGVLTKSQKMLLKSGRTSAFTGILKAQLQQSQYRDAAAKAAENNARMGLGQAEPTMEQRRMAAMLAAKMNTDPYQGY